MADENYPFKDLEPKWQKRWEEAGSFRTPEAPRPGRKFYCLDMFPYPSADGLHVGHPEGYTATDILCRYKRRKGDDVLHPMGWDAFGLPAENFAIQTGLHPRLVTQKNIANFKRQIRALGFSYDWEREIDTTDPDYYRWTQWIFLQLFKRGLAYEGTVPINWCPSCKTGLANEEVFGGACERCGTFVERRAMRQWLLKITAYAERLLAGLDGLDWPESTLAMQRNWIGRSEGAEIDFAIRKHKVTVFTTRPDTLFGATYMVLAPEHPLVAEITVPDQRKEVEDYVAAAGAKSELERSELEKEKTGVPTGASAVNPATGERIPVWIADYVLAHYGTGAIMAVPAHDQRDFEFARRYRLPVRWVVSPPAQMRQLYDSADKAYEGDGINADSGPLDGLATPEAKRRMIQLLEEKGAGRKAVSYRLRDWVFSRQRYWGEPIPVVHCAKCGIVPVPEDKLPVLLPDVRHYKPTGTGESPLADVHTWVSTHCPACSGPARRETNTMPQWAGSCWYYLRFMDPSNGGRAWGPEAEKAWGPVDCYVGGAEHAVLHLLYARFWHKVLFDLGLVSTQEPFRKLRHQGMIISISYRDGRGVYHPYSEVQHDDEGKPVLAGSGDELATQVEKMSKTKKNVINPDEILDKYGADVFRLYEMFMGPFADPKPWDMKDIMGRVRFLRRVWALCADKRYASLAPGEGLKHLRHQTIAKVGADIENLHFNTAISALDIYLNALQEAKPVARVDAETFLHLLNPFAPHVTEELWERIGHEPFLSTEPWPEHDPAQLKESEVEIVVQVNGKARARLNVAADSPDEALKEKALALPKVKEFVDGGKIQKVIVVKNRLINIVVK